jgi:hypothetical protein
MFGRDIAPGLDSGRAWVLERKVEGMRRFGTFVTSWAIICLAHTAQAGLITTSPVGTVDAEGWTQFTESADTIKIYVSNSTGNDANPGTEASPVKTIAKAKTMARFGKPDWVLLKRGDTWNETLSGWGISGRSASEPHVVMPYGSGPRPIIVVAATQQGNSYIGTTLQRFIAFVGIHFKNGVDPAVGKPPLSVRWFGCLAQNILWEDCLCEGPIIIQANVFGDIANVAFRRCLILDSWDPVKVQGIFTQKTDGILLEENILDHNGYLNPNELIGSSIIVNHNVYIQKDCANFCGRGNISLRAPSHGIQARVGGILDNNLFINNTFGALFGRGQVLDTHGIVSRNVVIDGKDMIQTDQSTNPPTVFTTYRAWGIEIHGSTKTAGTEVTDNLLINEHSAAKTASPTTPDRPKGFSFSCDFTTGGVGGCYNVELARNITYNWRRPVSMEGIQQNDIGSFNVHDNIFVSLDDEQPFIDIDKSNTITNFRPVHSFNGNTYYSTLLPAAKFYRFDKSSSITLSTWITRTGEDRPRNQDPQFSDPTRTIGTYMQSIGFAADFQTFITEIRKQSKTNWRPELTAPVINDWFRDGFTPAGGAVQPTGDVSAPNPGVLTISTPGTNQSSITIAYSGVSDTVGGSGFNNVQLWYKKGSGGTWTSFGTVVTAPLGNFTFNKFSTPGDYFFSTRAQDNAGNYSPIPTGNGSASITYSPPPARLVLDAHLDDDPADGVLDSSSFASHGLGAGATMPTVVAGHTGSAYDLNGTDQFIKFNGVAAKLAATNHFSISFWIKTPGIYSNVAPQTQGAMVGINTSSGGNAAVLVLASPNGAQDDNTFLVMDGGSANAFEGANGVVVADDTWRHVAYTSDSEVGRLYVDGVERSTHPVNYTLASTDQISIGQEFDTAAASNFINGLVDEIKVWDGTLTGDDIATVFSGGLPNGGDTIPPDPGAPTAPPTTTTASVQVAFSGVADDPGGSGLNNVRLWVKQGAAGAFQDSGLMQFASDGTFSYPGGADPQTYFFALQAEDNAGNKSASPVTSSVSTAYTPPPPEMVFHGKFDDDPADGVLDSSNGGNNGTCVAGKTPVLAAGKTGSAYNFDGIDDFVNINAVSDNIGLSQKFSVAMWVKIPNIFLTTNPTGFGAMLGVNNVSTDSSGGNSIVIAAGSSNAADNNELTVYDGYGLGAGAGGAFEAQTNTIIADNNWHYVVYTCAGIGGTGKLYIDAVQKSTHTMNASFTSSDLWSIGQEYDTNNTVISNPIKGLIDEVKIFNGVLSATDVTNLFNGQEAEPPQDTTPPSSGTVSSPPLSKVAPIAVNYSGVVDTGGSGLKEVHLWSKKGTGGTWADTGEMATTPSGVLNFAGVSGDADYFFALQTVDNANNTSATPSGSGQATTKFDATAPTAASVTAPAQSSNAVLSLTYAGAADAGSGVKQVALWVRKGAAAWASTGQTQTAASGGFTFNTSGDATYFFATQVEDNAGNFSPVPSGNGSASTVLDTTAPTPASVTAPQYSKTSPIALTYAGAADAGTGVKKVSLWSRKDAGAWTDTGQSQTTASGAFSFMPVGDGQYFFATQVEDNGGTVSPAPSGNGSANTRFDTQVPIAASITGPPSTKTSPVSLTFAGASDSGSGVKTVKLWSRKNNGAWIDSGQSQMTASGTFSFTTSGDGTYNFATQVDDNAGNVSATPSGTGSLTTSVDTTAPTGGSTTSTASTNVSPIAVSYSGVTDALSGVKLVHLWSRKDTGAWADTTLAQSATSGSFSYNPSAGTGTYYFAVVGEDNAGNNAVAPSGNGTSNTVYDVVKPVKGSPRGGGKSALSGFVSTSPITVDYDGASDQHSGLKTVHLWVRRNAGLWADTGLSQTTAAGSFSYPVTLGDGVYDFTTVSDDNAGNDSDIPTGAGEFTVTFDSVKPIPGTATSPSSAKTAPITVSYSGASDAQSGLQLVKLWSSKDGGAWTDSGLTQNTPAGSFPFSNLAGDGVYRFALQAEDKAGVLSDPPSGNGDCSTTVDNTAPTLGNVTAPATEDGTPIPVSYSGVSDGSGSGVKSVYLWAKKGQAGTFSNTGQSANGESGEFYYSGASGDDTYFFAIQTEDNAGNISPEPSSPQANTVLDTSFTPGSAASPAYTQAGPIEVTYSGAGNTKGTGLAAVHLYFRKGEDGAWQDSGMSAAGASGSFQFANVTGDDAYYFATRAEDNNGTLTKAPEGAGDTKTYLDSTPPEPGTLTTPQFSNVAQINVTYTGVTDDVSGLKEVRLWIKQGEAGEWQDTGLKATTSDGEFDYGPVSVEETYTFYLVSENNAGGKSADPTDEIVFGPPPAP